MGRWELVLLVAPAADIASRRQGAGDFPPEGQNRLGLPERHFDVLVHPDWVEGTTLPRVGDPLPELPVPENSIWVSAKG